ASTLARTIQKVARDSLNPHRALSLTFRVASSLEKLSNPDSISEENLFALIRFCGSSEVFGEMIASNPQLIRSLSLNNHESPRRDYRGILRSAVDSEKSFASELSSVRRAWSRLLVEIGVEDATGAISVSDSNRRQTELAVASINAAYLIARR